jgi:molybdopterin-containing oxidoreductase family membrane subunit
MWLKRFVIVVPSLALPLMPTDWGMYIPTWIELAITAAAFAGFALIFTLVAKLFPIISVWEMKEGWEHAHEASAPATLNLETGGAGDD